jgi:hypothetical protein
LRWWPRQLRRDSVLFRLFMVILVLIGKRFVVVV